MSKGAPGLKEVQLWVSEDSGFHWEPRSRTTPDLGKFTFRTSHDGEFWFATRTLTVDDEYSPPMNQTVEPSMKVIVDTIPPSIVLEPDGRRGSTATVRWEVKDEHLDLKTLVLEYQVEGAKDWRKVPIRRLSLLGARELGCGHGRCAPGSSERGRQGGKCRRHGDRPARRHGGRFGLRGRRSRNPRRLPWSRFRGPGSPITEGPGFPPIQENTRPGSASTSRSGSRRSLRQADARRRRSGRRRRIVPARSGLGSGRRSRRPAARARASASGRGRRSGQHLRFGNPFPTPETTGRAGIARCRAIRSRPGAREPARGPGGTDPAAGRTMLVPSPRFKLQYAIEDAGPSGPASVELWLTQDGGRTWIRRSEDPDRVSPFDVDLGGEGTFGICLVARSASGLGDQPPAPGDPPQSWVEVDSTPPSVQLYPPQIGTGPHAGKVAITWRASDLHLAPRSVSLFWRPDQPGATWQPIVEGQENMGQYVWTVPPSFPARFHLRVEAVDTLGHRGGAETTDSAPVIVDRSRPRSRIIGLDPNARAGDGPGARPLR